MTTTSGPPFAHDCPDQMKCTICSPPPVGEATREQTLQGTFACRYCGQDTPHHHTPWEIAAYEGKCLWCEQGSMPTQTRNGPVHRVGPPASHAHHYAHAIFACHAEPAKSGRFIGEQFENGVHYALFEPRPTREAGAPEEATVENAILRDAVANVLEVFDALWEQSAEYHAGDDAADAQYRTTKKRLQEALGVPALMLLKERPGGQKLYGAHYREMAQQRDEVRARLSQLDVEGLHAAASDLLHIANGGECDPSTLRAHASTLYAVASSWGCQR